MMNPVGFRFRPTDEEIVDHYLRPKNLETNTSRVDEVISTVDICSVDPWDLPSKSRIKSRDGVWYFFGVKEIKYNRGDQLRRTTKSGVWKKTGKTMSIIRKRRGNNEKIGEKRVLVFKHRGGSKSDWVMHEYHATPLSPPNQMMKYTLCKVEFKGEESEISSSSTGSEIENNHSLIPLMNYSGELSPRSEGSSYCQGVQNPSQLSSGFLGVQPETQLEDAVRRAINSISTDDWNSLFNDDDEQSKIVSVQEDCSDYRPPKPLTGVFDDHSSDDNDTDSDSISATTNSIETSSTCDSFGSLNHRIDQSKTQQSPDSTIKLVSSAQEVSQAMGQGTVTRENNMGEDRIKKKRASLIHRMIQRLVKKFHQFSHENNKRDQRTHRFVLSKFVEA
ncbi:PREDICTED: NAC domain-containing protein 4-like [Camelina sativa]|uniref:NAC domain-containing protein 4-like n=1 Tax=Camelina sativa TaxID=90675 RepID=A0ABM0WQ92_CAMSA|nr:PREDICTED: NAC domain-containing protein 4-like [Camelina sativa]